MKELYEKHGNGRERSSLKCLQETLENVIAGFDDVYIMIDSLDECGERIELLHWIKAMAARNSTKLHLLFTSRPEPDIVNHLMSIARLISAHFDALASASDIELYIDSRLRLNHVWDDTIKCLIKETLIAGANGMYANTHSPRLFHSLKCSIGSDGWHYKLTTWNIVTTR